MTGYNGEMDQNGGCPVCHAAVRPTDYFCFNCGKNLKPKPPSTSVSRQALLYLGSLLLPPLGLIWGWRYLRQPDSTSKIIGTVAILITFISLIVTSWLVITTINTVNKQVNQQLRLIQGF